MVRMQTDLDTGQVDRLRQIARSSHRSVSAVVREAVSEWLEQRGRQAEGAFPAETHGRYLLASDLVSVSEIALRSGRPVSTIQTWRRRYASFPQPTALATGPVWDWDDVERWLRRHAAGEMRRRGHDTADLFPADLPGAELVAAGLRDIASGRSSAEAALVSMATSRLRELGIDLPGRAISRPNDRLYELLERRVGEGGAHGRYNAFRRRLSSFLRALAVTRAQAG